MSSLPWIRRPLIGVDFETTGVDVETARIVTASVVRWGGGLPTVVGNWLSDLDGAEIPAEATEIHGITTGLARSAGRPAAQVVAEVVEALRAFAGEGRPLVAMNAQYDFTVLERECERHLVRSVWGATPMVLDPRVLDKHCDPWRKGRRRLIDLCHHYRVPMEGGAHNSEVDARAACGVVWKIAQRNRTLQKLDLGELHELQAEWAQDQHTSFRDYQLRKYGAADESPFAWPLIPRPSVDGGVR